MPIYQTSSFVFNNSDHAAARFGLQDAGNIYGRLTNPTEDVFEQRMAALEGGVAALAVASGAAAINYTIINLAQKGDHIVSAKNIYGGSYNLLAHTLPQYGISTTFVDVFDLGEVRAAVQENTKAIYIETLGNPNSDVVDIEALAKIAHENKIPLVVDNTFATPYLVRPIEYGADIVVHSATKFIGGHGTAIGGVIVDHGQFDWMAHADKFPGLTTPDESYHGVTYTERFGLAGAYITKATVQLMRDLGAVQSPQNAYYLNLGLESLHVRMQRHCENAQRVAEFLQRHGYVILARNYRWKHGEIDIICADARYLVFAEVKTRSGEQWGAPREAVTARKRERLVQTAQRWLLQYPTTKQPRFDVIEVVVCQQRGTCRIRHIPNAFEVN